MDKSDLAKQLDLYSNSIVAFIVFQGLAFCYNFGNAGFNIIVKANMSLSIGLTILFFVNTVLALFANRFLRLRLLELSEEYGEIVKAVYIGKSIVISIFGALPILVTVRFAIFHA